MKSSVWLAIMGVITRIRPFKTAHDSKGVAMGSLNLDAGSSAKLSGERELVFLANSGKQMDNGLTVDLSTLEAPLIDGSKKLVSQLTDDDKLALPLLIDHSWRIDRQAGTITKLTVDEDGLEAVAKLANVETGELVYQLAKDGALTNSFSISIDYYHDPGKEGIISGAQLVEISVVYKGADQRAALRSVNSHEGDNAMTNISDKISSKFDSPPIRRTNWKASFPMRWNRPSPSTPRSPGMIPAARMFRPLPITRIRSHLPTARKETV